ncbi:hypothetical protein [Achromobacter arsenitoxydans]|uniref:hypothetical protein n=1 Tax=Achromobacter arsenitoxydans TaxID=1147684 RepID=UPI001EE688D4|nr:hypothetical protein [Achromobacter arsenitoxydans]
MATAAPASTIRLFPAVMGLACPIYGMPQNASSDAPYVTRTKGERRFIVEAASWFLAPLMAVTIALLMKGADFSCGCRAASCVVAASGNEGWISVDFL